MKIILTLFAATMLLAACSNPVVDLKSPCVGAEGSPCERRAPDNQPDYS